MASMDVAEGTGVSIHSAEGRWIIAATALGSAVAMLDGTVVGIALPTIGRDFGAGLSTLQWTVTAYTLTLSALILIGGSLGDHYGRRRVFVIGVVWFAAASLLCGVALNASMLIAARALQGVGGAMLTPGSLAIIQSSFRREDRAQAIGFWSGFSGVATAIGPFVGGYLITAASWRWIFLLNLPLVAAVVWIALRHVPDTRESGVLGRLDISGAVLASAGLAAFVYGLIEGPVYGWSSPVVVVAIVAGVLILAAFIWWERRVAHPMLPLSIFASRQFSGANVVTFVVYGALGGALFLVPIQLQQVLGYSPLASGVALLPITLVMLTLSARAGRLSQRIGPRLPMTLGPIVAGTGLALLWRVQAGQPYVSAFLPAIVVFSLGLALTVAPLTSAVLSAAPVEKAGIASAVNNDVARAAGLIAVAALPALAGLTERSYLDPAAFSAGFQTSVLIAGGLCIAGGLIAAFTIPGRLRVLRVHRTEPHYSCALDAPPACLVEGPDPDGRAPAQPVATPRGRHAA
jgi:EmrB/QacA subfamily drug resistance transporter